MSDHSQIYCKTCGEMILKQWKGWPHKDVIPLLPRLIDGACENCGSTQGLNSDEIVWFNCHGAYTTGLPDYWLLEINSFGNWWGRPYLSESNCPICNGRAILSEMYCPNETHETAHNCPKCGVKLDLEHPR